MQTWQITFVDDHGVKTVERFDLKQKPGAEDAARLIRAKLLPVVAKVALHDLEGRVAEPTVKSLKDQNSIQILDISLVD